MCIGNIVGKSRQKTEQPNRLLDCHAIMIYREMEVKAINLNLYCKLTGWEFVKSTFIVGLGHYLTTKLSSRCENRILDLLSRVFRCQRFHW